MKSFFIFISLFLVSTKNFAKTTERLFKMDTIDRCYIRTIIQSPKIGIKIKADLLFLIGFGDRADNHGPLFNLMNEQGIRVISFDYPSHGASRCSNINFESFTSLSFLAEEIEEKTREDITRPLFLSGWSTGGLLALRMSQQNFLAERFVKGIVLITPALSVYNFAGGDGVIREKTLSQNTNLPHFGPPKPVSPFFTPLFTTLTKLNAAIARRSSLPFYTPMLVLVAGDRFDKYVKSSILKEWIRNSRSTKDNLQAFQCENSWHEMDNEISPIGPTVRNLIKDFVIEQSTKLIPIDQTACKSL